ncbi:ABC transporter transmembrane domain-containing protein [uncultured Tolumonas sp.]|uniref:ABC transporter transmembrane domain-containing protein n=1 Tax=uncultured Tolumonas sp. TaxID=263765 RepID=UPI002A0A4A18|nr:ABC transporter transmembrane domain-containing protein [uncultured Tolumonas sp.]
MSLIWQLRWFFRANWQRYSLTVTILCLIAVVQTKVPALIGGMIDTVVHAASNISIRPQFQTQLLTLLAIGLLVYILRYVWRVALYGAAYKLGYLLRQRLYQHYLAMDQHFYQTHRTGELMAHVSNDIQAVEMMAGEGILTLVDSIFMGCLVLGIMITQYSLPLTLMSLLPLPIMAFLVARIGREIHLAFGKAQAAFGDVNNIAHENMSGLRTLRLFAAEQYAEQQMQLKAEQANQANLQVARVDAKFEPVIYLCIGSAYLLAISGGSWLVWQHQLTIGQLTSFSLYLGQLIWPMFAIAWLFNILERGNATYQRIQTVLNTKAQLTSGIAEKPASPGDINIQLKRFENDTGIALLQQINLRIQPGKLVGIVGPTGAGKSTLLKLIQRFADPMQGHISLHQIPLPEWSLSDLRQQFAYVPQEPYLFSLSVADNIALGRPDATLEQVIAAAKLAELDSDIQGLPQGYQTPVGERGITLSGGQKQRLALARAWLTQRPYLLLDDALSAVDAKTASRILHNLRSNSHNMTLLMVTHRLQGLEHAAQILVLEQGEQRELGSHQRLLEQNGWYAKTWRYQQLEQALTEDENE